MISTRVEAAGAAHFGIVSVDCAKHRSKWMLCNFYGKVLIEPIEVEHTKGHLSAAVLQLNQGIKPHDIKDQVVAIERRGDYHEIPRRAFTKAGFEVRIVHPLATKQHRLPADPGIFSCAARDIRRIGQFIPSCGKGLRRGPAVACLSCLQIETRV